MFGVARLSARILTPYPGNDQNQDNTDNLFLCPIESWPHAVAKILNLLSNCLHFHFLFNLKCRLTSSFSSFYTFRNLFVVYPCVTFTQLPTWELPGTIIILLLATEQHHWSGWELSAVLKDNWSFIFFFLEREQRALVIHFPPFSHRITSQNFTLPLTPLHLFPLQMWLVHLDKTGALRRTRSGMNGDSVLCSSLRRPPHSEPRCPVEALYIACVRGNLRVVMQSASWG